MLTDEEQIAERGWRFHFRSDNLALNFVATKAGPRGRVNERLTSPELLREWLERAGLELSFRELTPDAAATAMALREAIAAVLETRGQSSGPEAAAIARINQFARNALPSPQLSDDGLSLRPDSARDFSDILGLIAADAVTLLGTVPQERVRQCASPDCPIWFVDHSRGNKRRWCAKSPCGDQESARAYRRRKSEKGAAK